MNQIIIFDTTLRDGQQCPGAGMSFNDNIRFFELAMNLDIDVIEAGFPSASKIDFKIVNEIAKQYSSDKECPVICGLCQLREEQVDITIDALKPAIKYKKARLHVYFPVDPDLIKASIGNKGNDLLYISKLLFEQIKKAVKTGLDVEFSPEGYSKIGENFDFTTDLIRSAVEAGATTINCPDTIGGAHKFQGEEYFVNKMNKHAKIIAKEFPNKKIIWSTHCHNDFGTAVENTMNAIFDGPVRQAEVTINGIGERAGNASLEQTVMLIKQFAHFKDSKNPLYTNIKTENLQQISDFISINMLPRQPHFPITGINAARHTAGGHTNAILKNPLVYQPFDPKEVGNEITLVFGPLSGGNHSKAIIEKYGYKCDDNEKAEIAQFIKDYYKDRRKGITDEELMIAYFDYRYPIKIDKFDYSKSSDSSSVYLKGKFFDKTGLIEKNHNGKDSALAALKDLIDEKIKDMKLEYYQSQSDTKGIDAKSVCNINVKYNDKLYEGIGVDADIEISAMKALINATNRAYIENEFRK